MSITPKYPEMSDLQKQLMGNGDERQAPLGWGFSFYCYVYQDYFEFNDVLRLELSHEGFECVYVQTSPPSRGKVEGAKNLHVDCGRISLQFYSYGYNSKEDAGRFGLMLRDALQKFFVRRNLRCDAQFLSSLLSPSSILTTQFFEQEGFIRFDGMGVGNGSGPSAPIFKLDMMTADALNGLISLDPMSGAVRRALAMKADFILLNSRGIGGSGDESMAELALNVSIIESFVEQGKVDESTRNLIDELKDQIKNLDDATDEQKNLLRQGLGNLKRKSIRRSVCEYVEASFPAGTYTPSHLEIPNENAGKLMDLCYNLRSKYFHKAQHQDLGVSNLQEHDLARHLVFFASEIASSLIDKHLEDASQT